jgi:hypothetical protein
MINTLIILEELTSLCDSWFLNPMIQTYAGSNRECMFCGAQESRNGGVDHSVADCPYMKYTDLLKRAKE